MIERAGSASPARRPPTAAEARALAHPLRLRILFACREHARTNKELADALDTTRGTIHYHLKPLVEQGFLRAEEPRRGPRGSTQQPYRATGKSWTLSTAPEDSRALMEAAATELLQVRGDDVVALARVGLTLPQGDLEELRRRLDDLTEEFVARSRTRLPGMPGATADEPAGGQSDELSSVTLLLSVHHSPLANRQPDA